MAELILVNGDIRTQDPYRPRAKAVALAGEKIVAIGDDKDIKYLIRHDSEVIDLGGRLVLPGLTDSHIHFLTWAMMQDTLPLSDTNSLGQVLEWIAQTASKVPRGAWINSMGFDEFRWPEVCLPNRDNLDSVAPAHPVFIRRRDGHMAVVNTMALELAGINESTPDPHGGVLERDENGRLNGMLREKAVELVFKAIPEPTEDEMAEKIRQSTPVLHGLGVTGIHDFRIPGEGATQFKAWQRLDSEGVLGLRCWFCLPGEQLEQAIKLGLKTGFGSDRLKIGHLKYFIDGSMGSQTAWMVNPYPDGSRGICVCSLADLAESIYRAECAGLGVAVHAIGDRANREIVKIFEKVSERMTGPGPAAPRRIEHAQIVRPEDMSRVAQLDVIASVQPLHLTEDITIHEERIGKRSRWAFALRDMIDCGIKLIFGSDSPVSDPNPCWGIHAAVTRRRRNGNPPDGWYPDQRLIIADAVWAYTMGPAFACGLEDKLGSITPGKLADLVVLDRNIYQIEPREIAEAQVDLTIFNGQIVFMR